MLNVEEEGWDRLTKPLYLRFKAYSHLEVRSIQYGHW